MKTDVYSKTDEVKNVMIRLSAVKPEFILKEIKMPFAKEYERSITSCQRINNCSCDCNRINCSPFIG